MSCSRTKSSVCKSSYPWSHQSLMGPLFNNKSCKQVRAWLVNYWSRRRSYLYLKTFQLISSRVMNHPIFQWAKVLLLPRSSSFLYSRAKFKIWQANNRLTKTASKIPRNFKNIGTDSLWVNRNGYRRWIFLVKIISKTWSKEQPRDQVGRWTCLVWKRRYNRIR